MPKYHTVVEDDNVAIVTKTAKLLLEIENIVDEILSEHQIEEHKYRVEGLEDPNRGTVHVYIDLNGKCSKEVSKDDKLIKVSCQRVLPNVNEIFRYIVINLAKISVNLLRPFLGREEEYMVIFLDRGSAAILEGSPEKVVAPFIPGTVFTCHTHPNTYRALLSKEDARSLLELLSNRGLGSCVISTSSCLVVYRCGPFVLDDYFKLFNAIKDQEYIDIITLSSLGLESIEGVEFIT
ncbi:MAG: hypothetical protein QW775_01565 [Ignisphaera sp.]|uniref:Uncharacterized protein n=1 Tax=Ignisphaera aggregans TaxID=334771 RepID=A0A7C4JLC2_9CREN